MKPVLIACLLPLPVAAENLCGVTDPARLASLAGDYGGVQHVSLDSLDTARLPPPEDVVARIGLEDGQMTLSTAFIDSLTGDAAVLTLAEPAAYDVDRVDDFLDTTDHAQLADILSDTQCGPADLPQLVARIDIDAGIAVTGTITLIAYFDDRILQIGDLELRGEGALIYMTQTALLTPKPPS